MGDRGGCKVGVGESAAESALSFDLSDDAVKLPRVLLYNCSLWSLGRPLSGDAWF